MVAVAETVSRVFDWLTGTSALPMSPNGANGQRAFMTGPGVVSALDRVFGIDPSTFQPEEYANYLATSNAVYTVSKLRANLLASLPIRLYKVKPNGDRDIVTSGDLFTLLQKVNPYWTSPRLIEMMELSLCLWGTVHLFVERGKSGRGRPRELWWARSDQVRVVPDPVNYVAGFLYRGRDGREIPFSPQETIWIRYANPIDEYSGLSPLAAARLAADVGSAAMKSNKQIFSNGMQAAGFVAPIDNNEPITKQGADELMELLRRRLSGVDNAHRWIVLSRALKFEQLGFSPKDAEFLGAMKQSLEDVARAYGVPIDLVGGQRTFENVAASERLLWAHTIQPEARLIAAELTEQLLPMFPGEADVVEFDFTDVAALHESETARWERSRSQIETGATTVNEWRVEEGRDPVPWGDAWWAPFNLAPVRDSAEPLAPGTVTVTEVTEGGAEDAERALTRIAGRLGLPAPTAQRGSRELVYGSAEHERMWRAAMRKVDPWERKIEALTVDLLGRQRTSVLARVKAERGKRALADVVDEPFDLPRWTRLFREQMRQLVLALFEDIGGAAINDLDLTGISFDLYDPRVTNAIEQRANLFAREVNQTTFDALKTTLAEGLEAGESITDLAARVEQTMGVRTSDAVMIARTEATAASTAADVVAWDQTGVVQKKQWLAALDDRTRESHVAAHGQTVGLNEDFTVGGATGPSPGNLDQASEVVNCRCSMTPVISDDQEEAG